jgi:hypothetical protein
MVPIDAVKVMVKVASVHFLLDMGKSRQWKNDWFLNYVHSFTYT